jgi:hypothetical protein
MCGPSPSLNSGKQTARVGPHGVVPHGLQGNKLALNAPICLCTLGLVGLGNRRQIVIREGQGRER